MTRSQKHILGWHFLPATGCLAHTGEKVHEGKTYTVRGPLKMCSHGLHFSRGVLDALTFAPGSICCRIEASGDIVCETAKCVCSKRTVLWMLPLEVSERVLHEFVCRQAEAALKVANVTDPSAWNAIHTKRKWLQGDATDKDLDAARDAARAAARAADRDAVWAADRAAARAAARDAAWAAALAAARDAALDAANRQLTAMICAAHSKELRS